MRGPDGGPVQVGVTSWAATDCAPRDYSVFTSVADFEAFIRNFVPDASFADPNATGRPIGAAAGASQGDQPMEDAPQVALDVQPAGNIHTGTKLQIRVESSVPGTLVVVNIDAAGQVTQLYPNRIASRRLG